mgnify:CR=1 FL=1
MVIILKIIWKGNEKVKREERIKQLFSAVLQRNGLSLSIIFSQFAVKWDMKKESVRNIYYRALNKMLDDEEYAKSIGIDFRELNKNEIKPFDELELNQMLCEIEGKLSEGKSIRKACYELAGGDVELMLRYQNKYRAIKNANKDINNLLDFDDEKRKTLARQSGEVQSNLKKTIGTENGINMQMMKAREKYEKINYNKMSSIPDNVIPFRRKRETSLTDGELQSLFMGLVRIVRNSAVVDVDNALKEQCNKQAIEVRNLLKNLNVLKEELNESLRENSKLKKELEIVKMDKVKDYEKFMLSLNQKAENKVDDSETTNADKK